MAGSNAIAAAPGLHLTNNNYSLGVCCSGTYTYKKHNTLVDCTRTIFILTTNAADAVIQQYCSDQQKFHSLQVACAHPHRLVDEMAELDSMVTAALKARFKVLTFSCTRW
jgi:ATP-dependent Clp protease ATP-binding subunit ClpA